MRDDRAQKIHVRFRTRVKCRVVCVLQNDSPLKLFSEFMLVKGLFFSKEGYVTCAPDRWFLQTISTSMNDSRCKIIPCFKRRV